MKIQIINFLVSLIDSSRAMIFIGNQVNFDFNVRENLFMDIQVNLIPIYRVNNIIPFQVNLILCFEVNFDHEIIVNFIVSIPPWNLIKNHLINEVDPFIQILYCLLSLLEFNFHPLHFRFLPLFHLIHYCLLLFNRPSQNSTCLHRL